MILYIFFPDLVTNFTSTFVAQRIPEDAVFNSYSQTVSAGKCQKLHARMIDIKMHNCVFLCVCVCVCVCVCLCVHIWF